MTRDFENAFPDPVGIRDMVDEKSAPFGGAGLDRQVAVMEEGWKKTADHARDILNLTKGGGRNAALEKADLGNVDQAVRGDDKNIKLLIGKADVGEKQAEQKVERQKDAHHQPPMVKGFQGEKTKPEKYERQNGQEDKEGKGQNNFDIDDRVLMDHLQNLFVGALSREMHHGLKVNFQ